MERAEKIRPANALINMASNDHEPATKGDISAVRTELSAVRHDLTERMDRMHDDLVEKMRDMQTEVLRAFLSWARPIEIRLRAFDDIQQRLGLLEERVSAIERGDKPAA